MHSGTVQQHLHPNGASKPGRRLRLLICACTSQQASEVFRSLDGAETVHIPSDDISEVGVELSEVHPDFVLCKTDFLLRLIPRSRNGQRPHWSEPRNDAQSKRTPVLLASSDISPRDLEVLQLLAKGARNLDIAQALKLAESSVKRILQRLYERFEAANRAELLGRAMELQLFPERTPDTSSSNAQ
jgi:DNA-binding CsgD family transcriptional regulator